MNNNITINNVTATITEDQAEGIIVTSPITTYMYYTYAKDGE
jgi:hypothetical protein